MFIIPIGHESNKVRQLPVVTIAIVAICILVHIVVSIQISGIEEEIAKTATQLFQMYFTKPHLEIKNPEIKKYLAISEKDQEMLEEFRSKMQKAQGRGNKEEDSAFEQTNDQEVFDELCEKLTALFKEVPFLKYGYRPSEKSFMTLITAMFLHGDIWHLLGNLLFLLLTCPFIEDRWGKVVFGSFYILAGMISALLYGMHYPDYSGVLIGASGAISGAMGAFLINFWTTRIRFGFYILLFQVWNWTAPAWLYLPFWFLKQLLAAKLVDSLKLYGGSGVAFWAHVWGFVFGVAVAIGLKVFKIEQKYLTPMIEAKTTFVNKSFALFEEGMAHYNGGRKLEGLSKLRDAVMLDDSDADIVETWWDLSGKEGKEKEAAPYLVRLMEKNLRSKTFPKAVNYYWSIKEKLPDMPLNLDINSKFLLMEAFIEESDKSIAEACYMELKKEVDPGMPPGTLLEYCRVVLKLDERHDLMHAQEALELTLQHPGLTPEKRKQLTGMLYRPIGTASPQPAAPPPAQPLNLELEGLQPGSGGRSPAPPSPAPPSQTGVPPVQAPRAAPPPQPQRPRTHTPQPPVQQPTQQSKPAAAPQQPTTQKPKTLKITKAVPMGVKEGKLAINTESGQRILSLDRIMYVCVVKIAAQGQRPVLVIDLFLSDPKSPKGDVRAIRFLSTGFNPQKFVPKAQSPMEAFKVFVSALLKLSGGKPMPSLESVQLTNMKTYPSLQAYENWLLSI